ncbi:MAG TPA: hypothetical protein VMV52_04035 [Candidatus Nanopelagicaceae bacterium]|nr:hypothetical protein [Candidatus Nanopelagicaceae bacterium]
MRKSRSKKKVVPSSGANPAMTQAVQELRRSGAASKHADRRTRRSRARAAALAAALEEQR